MRRVVFAAILLLPTLAAAGDSPSQDQILAAVRAGEMRPLAEIEQLVKPRLPGAILKVEIERKRGVWIYEFKTLDDAGRRHDVYVDARSGAILKADRK